MKKGMSPIIALKCSAWVNSPEAGLIPTRIKIKIWTAGEGGVLHAYNWSIGETRSGGY